VAIVSFRLGGGDGVSVEAVKWADALRVLGFDVTTIAGAGGADVVLPGLAIGAQDPPPRAELEDAFAGAALVVVENLCSLPLNPAAGELVADVLVGRPAVMHDHDLPWQRSHYAGFPTPRDDPAWVHVTINQISRLQLAARGIEAVVIRNTFDVDRPLGDRTSGRERIGVPEEERLVLQPTRAIERKNVPSAIALCEEIESTLWLLGPPEDGFEAALHHLVSHARCPVVLGHAPGADDKAMADAYAACDLVALPSTWEGFGNPAVESAVHRRPLAIGHYPVAAELAAFGFRWFAVDDLVSIRRWLDRPDYRLLDHNHSVASDYFSSSDLPSRLSPVLDRLGTAPRASIGPK
jgi:mannosylglucosylglycerate synthase